MKKKMIMVITCLAVLAVGCGAKEVVDKHEDIMEESIVSEMSVDSEEKSIDEHTEEMSISEQKEEIQLTGKIIKPIEEEVNPENINGIYPCNIEDIQTVDEKTECKVDIYTMDLYDAVDVTTMEKGDIIVINGNEMIIDTIEEKQVTGSLSFEEETDESKTVYIINGEIEEGGASLISYEGGTFRYFGMDNHATYTEKCEVTIPFSEKVNIIDNSFDYEGADTSRAATGKTAKEFQEYFEEDDYFFIYNTEIRVEDGVIVELTRRFIP